MEFYIVYLAVVVVVLILFACSITNFLNELPKCRKATREAIDCTVVRMGYFIKFKGNVKILGDKINELTTLIQEFDESQSDQFCPERIVPVREEAVEVSEEAERTINSRWYKRWSTSCYQLSTRVATTISKVDYELNFCVGLLEPEGDAIPGIVVVILIAYSLTNAVLHLPNSTTTKADVINWIVVEMAYPFKIKTYFQRLKDRINLINRRRSWLEKDPRNYVLQMLERDDSPYVGEAQLLCDEAEYMMNYWYKGWTGSRYRICKRAEEVVKCLTRDPMKGGGSNSRGIIFSVDKMSQTLPGAITAIRHYLHFNKDIKLLKEIVIDRPQRQLSAKQAQKVAKEVKLLETAQDEAMQLIQQAQSCVDRQWYKISPATRYRLHKRLAKKVIQLSRLEDNIYKKLDELHQHTGDIPQGTNGGLPL